MIIDLRVLNNPKSKGLVNSMVGFGVSNPSVQYLIADEWVRILLIEAGVSEDRILFGRQFLFDHRIRGQTIALPIQRPVLDVAILWIFRVIRLQCFVHDLHYRSRRPLLMREFRGIASSLKRMVYDFVVNNVEKRLVHSRLVQRQIKAVFKLDSELVTIKRVFRKKDVQFNLNSATKPFDYFLPLASRHYKGTWVLDRLQFEVPESVIAVDEQHASLCRKILSVKNPRLKIFGVNLETDECLVSVYSKSKSLLYLSRHEGFGFIPYEAARFGVVPIVLNCSAYLEVSSGCFWKIPLTSTVCVPAVRERVISSAGRQFAEKHVIVV